jgi:hypothetical protein
MKVLVHGQNPLINSYVYFIAWSGFRADKKWVPGNSIVEHDIPVEVVTNIEAIQRQVGALQDEGIDQIVVTGITLLRGPVDPHLSSHSLCRGMQTAGQQLLEDDNSGLTHGIDPELGRQILAARKATSDAAAAQSTAAIQSRELMGKMKAVGMTGRQIAALLGLSEQRVSQLLRGV